MDPGHKKELEASQVPMDREDGWYLPSLFKAEPCTGFPACASPAALFPISDFKFLL